MRKASKWAVMLAAMAALALFVAACGGSSKKSSSSSPGSTGTTVPSSAKKGGDVSFLAAGDVDYLDPGQTYYTFGYMVLYSTNRTLYSFKPDNSQVPVPDLATGPPEIAADQKTITVHIKPGIKYSPPLQNETVKAADIKYAFERAFTKQVPSGYAGTYFGSIVGAPAAANTGNYKPISGITTPDDTTIVFHLSTADAVNVSQALVMPITVPVPKSYALKFDQKTPSTYDQHVVFTGPYMVKNDASGKLIGRTAGKEIDLIRNPSWQASTDYRPAYLNSITIKEGNNDLTVASRQTLSGQNLLCCDAGQLPPPVLKQALSHNKSQIAFIPSGGTRWIAINTTIKPFDNVNVRKAIIAVFDRNALLLTRGGKTVGDLANGYIPPGIPGFNEAGGLTQNTNLDFMKYPSGNLQLAMSYMKKAGYPSGKYTGGQKFLTIATNADPGIKTAQVAQGQFAKLGFQLNFREVPQDTLYTKFCGVPKTKVVICPNVGWFKDYTDPESMLKATFDGHSILQQGNVNWSQLNDTAINDAMDKAALLPVGTARNQAWAKINAMIAADAPGIPYIWDKTVVAASSNLNEVTNGYYTTQDLNYTSVK
jgi:peptide/nickel transport system substrate-binding protein